MAALRTSAARLSRGAILAHSRLAIVDSLPLARLTVRPAARPRPTAGSSLDVNGAARRNYWREAYASARSYSSTASGGSSSAAAEPKPPLSQRLKTLIRTQGWTALVVYLAFSAVDFGLTFLLVYSVGADKVRDAEDWVLHHLEWKRKGNEEIGPLRKKIMDKVHERQVKNELAQAQAADVSLKEDSPTPARAADSQAVAAAKANSKGSAIATTAVLAYAIHKTLLLPVRLGLTVAITPRLVRYLQSWGWKVGTLPASAGAAAAAAAAKA